MKKAKFLYTKEDGEKKSREILCPEFLKETANYLKDFQKEEVKYLKGYELDDTNLNDEDVEEYQKTLEEYVNLRKPTLKEFFESKGLDVKLITEKSFKKSEISLFEVIEEKIGGELENGEKKVL